MRPVLLASLAVLSVLVAAIAPTAAAPSAKPKRVYCKRHHHPRGCVKVPKSAIRPRGVNQQGSSSLTPHDVENGGGLGGGPGHHGAAALQWAKSQLGLRRWAWRCERFVEEAYGTHSEFPTAAQAAKQLHPRHAPVGTAAVGSLIYFRADQYNRGWGHVGISLGNGKMISALAKVGIVDIRRSRYWRGLYLGWTYPPHTWPGRIPLPPGGTTPDPKLTVRITAPSVGGTVSGVVPLIASASGGSGVDFDAYYGTDQRDPSSRGWHRLGRARRGDGGWVLEWDTRGVPDQGFDSWGTINIAAIALNAAGKRTGTRDYRRIALDNTTGVVTPPVTGGGTLETAGGVANTWSDYKSAGGIAGPTLGASQTVRIACKVQGFQVADGDTWWYRIADPPWSNAFYVSADAFYNNGQTTGSLQGTPFVDTAVPNC